MARSAQKIETLLEDEPELANALAVVVERADGGEAEVEWGDVSDDISSGQWGRLIEQGILVDGNHGFVIANSDATTEALESTGVSVRTTDTGDVETTPIDDEDSGWSTWDKAAAGGSFALMIGYMHNDIRNLVGTTIDLALGPLDQLLPFYAVIMVVALITGVNSSLLMSLLMDSEKLAVYQENMQSMQDELQERREKAKERGDDEELKQIQQEQMEAFSENLGMFKLQFRPMVWTMLVTIPVFLWMYWKILPAGGGVILDPDNLQVVMPLVGQLQGPEGGSMWQAGLLGPMPAWIVWYFLCSMAFGQIVRKALNVQTTPGT